MKKERASKIRKFDSFDSPIPRIYNPGLAILLVLFSISDVFFLNWLSSFPSVLPSAYVIFYSATTAVIGWIVGAYISTNNLRKQHTVNVLLNYHHSDIFRKAAEEFQSGYPDDTKMTKEDLTNSDKENANEAARYLLNHMEFIAAGIKTRDLNSELLYNTIRGQLCTICAQAKVYIDDSRGQDREGNIKYPRIYEHLIALYQVWKVKR